MSWFKAKIDSKVNASKGDTIKNSNINISNNTDHVIMEIYNKLGRVEGQVRCISKDVTYIRDTIEEHTERIAKLEHSIFKTRL